MVTVVPEYFIASYITYNIVIVGQCTLATTETWPSHVLYIILLLKAIKTFPCRNYYIICIVTVVVCLCATEHNII